jgi:hypothetical protein
VKTSNGIKKYFKIHVLQHLGVSAEETVKKIAMEEYMYI